MVMVVVIVVMAMVVVMSLVMPVVLLVVVMPVVISVVFSRQWHHPRIAKQCVVVASMVTVCGVFAALSSPGDHGGDGASRT